MVGMTQNPESIFHSASVSKSGNPSRLTHYSIFAIILCLGAALRLWQLDAKALWLDEVIGALFSFGRDLGDVPLDQFFDFSAFDQLFSLNAEATCAQIAQSVATDSVHPPIYFCLAHWWLALWQPGREHWIWVLRSLPALVGVACIPALYGLNRTAFSSTAGIIGAALMAVSPFAVYLSQEARHYTLPMLLTLLTLTALVKLQHSFVKRQALPWLWLTIWAVLNSLGMYVHYFYILVVLAQVASIGAVVLWVSRHAHLSSPEEKAVSLRHSDSGGLQTHPRMRQSILRFGIALTALGVSYIPWLPTLINHFGRPETDWLKPYNPDWSDRLAPLYQTLSGWLLMVVAFPIENQPWPIIIPSALGMVVMGGWILGQAALGLWSLWHDDGDRRPVLILLGVFVVTVLLEFFGITYLLDKDVTSVPRYNFVYYPGMAALIAAGLAHRVHSRTTGNQSRLAEQSVSPSEPCVGASRLLGVVKANRLVAIALLAGIISSLCVVYGLVFQKGYYPHIVARDLTVDGDRPVMLVVSYQSLQEVGLGLSFALELEKQYSHHPEPPVRMAFIHRPAGYRQVWRSLSRLKHTLPLPINLWVVASPGMKTDDYPKQITLRKPHRTGRITCNIDPTQFNRIGFPYQLFRCIKPSS